MVKNKGLVVLVMYYICAVIVVMIINEISGVAKHRAGNKRSRRTAGNFSRICLG
jgi:hypothetical protein